MCIFIFCIFITLCSPPRNAIWRGMICLSVSFMANVGGGGTWRHKGHWVHDLCSLFSIAACLDMDGPHMDATICVTFFSLHIIIVTTLPLPDGSDIHYLPGWSSVPIYAHMNDRCPVCAWTLISSLTSSLQSSFTLHSHGSQKSSFTPFSDRKPSFAAQIVDHLIHICRWYIPYSSLFLLLKSGQTPHLLTWLVHTSWWLLPPG